MKGQEIQPHEPGYFGLGDAVQAASERRRSSAHAVVRQISGSTARQCGAGEQAWGRWPRPARAGPTRRHDGARGSLTTRRGADRRRSPERVGRECSRAGRCRRAAASLAASSCAAHSGGPRAGRMVGGAIGWPRVRRMSRTVVRSVMQAMMRIAPPHLGYRSSSMSATRSTSGAFACPRRSSERTRARSSEKANGFTR